VDTPLQVYSALIFCPENSIIKRQFRDDIPNWIKSLRVAEQDWDPCVCTLHYPSLRAAAFSPDGRILAMGGSGTGIELWDCDTGEPRVEIATEGQRPAVTAVAFSPDGQTLASISEDGVVDLWNSVNGKLKQTIRQEKGGGLGRVHFAPDGRMLAFSVDTTISLWDTVTADDRSLRCLKGHKTAITSLAFSSDGKLLASGSQDGNIVLWACTTGYPNTSFQHPHEVSYVAVSPVDSTVVAACGGGTASVWNVNQGSQTRHLGYGPDSTIHVAFTRHGTLLALTESDNGDRQVQHWDPVSETSIATQYLGRVYSPDRRGSPVAVSISEDGKHFAIGFDDDEVEVYAPTKRSGSPGFDHHSSHVRVVAFSPCGRLFASASEDKIVKLWDPATGICSTTLIGASDFVVELAFSPDRRYLASGLHDGTVIIWEMATYSLHRTLRGHSGEICRVSFSPNSHLLASAHEGEGDIAAMLLWDCSTWALLHSWTISSFTTDLVTFSPDCSLLAVSSWEPRTYEGGGKTAVADLYDGFKDGLGPRILVWETETRETILDFRTSRCVTRLCFDPTSTILETNCEIFRLPQPIGHRKAESKHAPEGSPDLCAIEVEVVYKGLKIMDLPEGYRYRFSAGRNGVVPLVHNSGRITFLEFDVKALEQLVATLGSRMGLEKGLELGQE
jgi:WD40 repeat protein